MKHAQVLIVIENAGENYSAYSPDLPGCVATGATRDETERNMDEAIQVHIEASWKMACRFRRARRSRSTWWSAPDAGVRVRRHRSPLGKR